MPASPMASIISPYRWLRFHEMEKVGKPWGATLTSFARKGEKCGQAMKLQVIVGGI